MEKPIIAQVNGVAAGAGLGIALAADLRIASDKSSFVTAFIGIALAPDSGVSWHLQRLIGPARAFELLASGRKVRAEEALSLGLVNQAVPADALDETVTALARQFALAPTRSIGLTKRVLNRAATMTLAEALEDYAMDRTHSAVEALKEIPFDGLVRTNEKIYELLTLGKSLQQSVNGDIKSFTLQYIDWENLGNNVFHVTEEFAVERTGSHQTRRPDVVLFVNGIPLSVIECSSSYAVLKGFSS